VEKMKGDQYMKFIVSGKNINVTDALREKIESKLSKLGKFFNEDTEIHATFSVQKNAHILEVTIPFKGIIFRAEQSNEDMYASIDKVVDILERQIIKNKTKLERRFKEESLRFEQLTSDFKGDTNEENYKIVKTKRFAMKPMSTEEAILQMNLLGHSFFMFRNTDTNQISVVYKRNDQDYGIIEPEE
jgi:putative sigma-54 modulation protein